MWSSREPLKNRPIILLIISKSFRAGNVNIIRQKQKSIPPLLKYCWENLSHSTLPGEFFVLQTRDLHRLLRLVAQRYNSWHDNKVRDRQKKKKKEQFPSEPAHLMNPFVTDGKVCQHTAPLEFFSPPYNTTQTNRRKCLSPPGSSLWSYTRLFFQQECPMSAEAEKETLNKSCDRLWKSTDSEPMYREHIHFHCNKMGFDLHGVVLRSSSISC